MPARTSRKKALPPLEQRFDFLGDGMAVGRTEVLRPALFEVEDRQTGREHCLKLWRKTSSTADADFRELWRHEMRQVQRIMAYPNSREVIVDVLDFVEDETHFGVLLERAGKPLSGLLRRIGRQHWLLNPSAPRSRTLLWRNVRRIVTGLGIVHAQGLVHGNVGLNSLFSEGSEHPDFQLSGFEWSLSLSADSARGSHAKLIGESAMARPSAYSFAEDWRALGLVVAHLLRVEVRSAGEVLPIPGPIATSLQVSERVWLKRLISPSRLDALDAGSIQRGVDDILAHVGHLHSTRPGTSILLLAARAGASDVIYGATNGGILIDDAAAQLDWIRADFDSGATLLVPPEFDPASGRMRIVTAAMEYGIRAFTEEDGSPVWDIAVCDRMAPRKEAFSTRRDDEHILVQPVEVTVRQRDARDARSRLGPDALDWSAFAKGVRPTVDDRTLMVRKALLLIQIMEAVVKALEIYPIEIVHGFQRDGQRFVDLRADPDSERDELAKRVGLLPTAEALRRLFEQEASDADTKWRISQSTSLGQSRMRDVTATFFDIVDINGVAAFRFEVDFAIDTQQPLYLRPDRDIGTENVIRRRLRNIAALESRADLLDMLDDPWRVRRTHPDTLDDSDPEFHDLDEPKQKALRELSCTSPSYFTVGPPGVGKTKLATEVVRRRFADDSTSRILVSAQGHDALDNLQHEIIAALAKAGQHDQILVRSSSSQRRPANSAEVQHQSAAFLERLSTSTLAANAPASLRRRVTELASAAHHAARAKDQVDKEQREGLRSFSMLVLDSANVVLSTANSADIERFAEDRAQFDWMILEEAGKATGPEAIGPMMLSGRRLLIGDHRQLPPFDADRLRKILADHALVQQALGVAERLIGGLLREADSDMLEDIVKNASGQAALTALAVRLLQPFMTFVDEDERRVLSDPGHRRIAATLTEQRRMDPAIAEIISRVFYGGTLKTNAARAAVAEAAPAPVRFSGGLPLSPVVAVDFPHVSQTGKAGALERGQPRWHNPAEIDAVIDVLRQARANGGDGTKPTLAVLSPYAAQVRMLSERIQSLRSGPLSHLSQFKPVRDSVGFVATVDAFQGSEADLVIISLVRNNMRVGYGALGFLRDRRRMNVLLSRAKSQLILVGSLSFLDEAVRGVNPDAGTHDLSFISDMTGVIRELTRRQRPDGLPLATIITPDSLRRRS